MATGLMPTGLKAAGPLATGLMAAGPLATGLIAAGLTAQGLRLAVRTAADRPPIGGTVGLFLAEVTAGLFLPGVTTGPLAGTSSASEATTAGPNSPPGLHH